MSVDTPVWSSSYLLLNSSKRFGGEEFFIDRGGYFFGNLWLSVGHLTSGVLVVQWDRIKATRSVGYATTARLRNDRRVARGKEIRSLGYTCE